MLTKVVSFLKVILFSVVILSLTGCSLMSSGISVEGSGPGGFPELPNLLLNAELEMKPGKDFPDNWVKVEGSVPENIDFNTVDDERIHTTVVRFDKPQQRSGVAIRSEWVPAEAGATYHASALVKGDATANTRLSIWYSDSNGNEKVLERFVESREDDWTLITVSRPAPNNAVGVRIELRSTSGGQAEGGGYNNYGESYYANLRLWKE